jgi:hypothetical protein
MSIGDSGGAHMVDAAIQKPSFYDKFHTLMRNFANAKIASIHLPRPPLGARDFTQTWEPKTCDFLK